MPNWMAALWSSGLIVYALWMSSLLLFPGSRPQGAVLLIITLIGYMLRSATGLKWTLVILTFESAIRIGMLPETRRYVANVLSLRSRFGG